MSNDRTNDHAGHCMPMVNQRERPILFSGPMVRAILDGRKTQTRRIVKPPKQWIEKYPILRSDVIKGEAWWWDGVHEHVGASQPCPYGAPGERLWVREAMRLTADDGKPVYEADGELVSQWRRIPENASTFVRPFRPAMLMPRWASRITLELIEVRVQHVAEISEEDATAEGCEARPSGTWWQGYRDHGEKLGLMHQQHKGDEPPDWMIEPHKMNPTPWLDRTAVDAFRILWESINPGTWAPNPCVWALTFRRVTDK